MLTIVAFTLMITAIVCALVGGLFLYWRFRKTDPLIIFDVIFFIVLFPASIIFTVGSTLYAFSISWDWGCIITGVWLIFYGMNFRKK